MRYRCGHCMVDLGAVTDGEPQPQCVDHPGGQVEPVRESSDDIAVPNVDQ